MAPGQPLGEEGEHYLALSPVLLQALKELGDRPPLGDALPVVQLLIQVARVDQVSGNIVLSLRFVRELGDGEQ